MRRLLALLLSLAAMFCLCGCMGDASIDELLAAPSLTDEQQAVLAALEGNAESRISFVFPATGANRAAVQLTDLDGDGSREAVAFFSSAEESLYAGVAILEPEADGSYSIAAVAEGLGDGVASCSFIRAADPVSRVLLIEWSSPGKSANSIAAYHYTGDALELGFEENCTELIVLDLDGDDSSEFCYVTPASSSEAFSIKLVKLNGASLAVEGQRYLGAAVLGIRAITGGSLSDGSGAVFLDELTEDGLQTEIFTLSQDGRLVSAVYGEGYDIALLSQRPDDEELICRSVAGSTCFPSAVAPMSGILAPDNWIYWYTVGDGAVSFARGCYFSSEYGYALCIPESWLLSCVPVVTEADTRFVRIYDTAQEKTLLTLCALAVDDDAGAFISSGYALLGSSGGYRFYVQLDCSEEDARLVRSSFFTF